MKLDLIRLEQIDKIINRLDQVDQIRLGLDQNWIKLGRLDQDRLGRLE